MSRLLPPWKCRNCGEQRLGPKVVDYSTEMEHDGRRYSLGISNLEVHECAACHNQTLPDSARKMVWDALRAKAGLLSPPEIREKRQALGLTQEQLADYVRVGKETVSRWETGGQIQQRAMDLLLRVLFGVSLVRSWLDAQQTSASASGAAMTGAPIQQHFGPPVSDTCSGELK